MKVLVLGGTGSIGGAVVQQLLAHDHDVIGLARSERTEKLLRNVGAQAVSGDIKSPENWLYICDQVDGVIHAAATWDEEMSGVDQQLVHEVLSRLALSDTPKAFIYTGGCWLYGETGDSVATENTVANELKSFEWTLSSINNVLNAVNVRGMVVHPAMVYERGGGVFEHIYSDIKQLGYTRVVKSESIRWPLVHRTDLADLYVLMLERGKAGDVFNGSTNDGVPIGVITRAIAKHHGITTAPEIMDVATACKEIGSYAEGYALDQQMSSVKAREQLGWRPRFTDPLAVIS